MIYVPSDPECLFLYANAFSIYIFIPFDYNESCKSPHTFFLHITTVKLAFQSFCVHFEHENYILVLFIYLSILYSMVSSPSPALVLNYVLLALMEYFWITSSPIWTWKENFEPLNVWTYKAFWSCFSSIFHQPVKPWPGPPGGVAGWCHQYYVTISD